MSFSIDIQLVSTFKSVRITNNKTNEFIEIITKGGLLNSWMQSNDNWDIINGNEFNNGWENFESNGFKSGKMSPYACRLLDGEYQHLNQPYKVEKFYLGAHGLHGIIYDAEYNITTTEVHDGHALVILEHEYKGTDKGYPFAYHIQLCWTFFENQKISIQTTIQNKSNISIPMMDGWHPYFKLGETINDCSLQFKNEGMLEYNTDLIPTGKMINNTVFENGGVLGNLKLDNGYLLNPKQPQCILENYKYSLTITPGAEYPYLQLYTPDDRKSIAIENLTGAPNCFNNKMGLHLMQPQSVWTLETTYQLRRK